MSHYLKIELDHRNTDDVIDPDTGYLTYDITDLKVKIEQTYLTKKEEGDLAIDYSGYTPTKGDKLYFLPGCSVPRVKLKDLTLQYGIKSVRDIDEATILVGSNNTISKMTTGNWKYVVPVNIFKELIEFYKEKLDDYVIDNINTALEFYTLNDLVCDWSTLRYFTDEDYSHYKTLTALDNYEGFDNELSKYFVTVDDEYRSIYDQVINKHIISEASVLEHLNGPDSVIIDNEMFEQLSSMFNSSDTDNHILAMEIMANSNYKKSLLYLEMLICDHSPRIYESRTKNHVNFKSLVSYLGKQNSLSTDMDDIIKSLAKRNVLTADKVDIILDRYKTEIVRHGEKDHFLIKEVTLSEEMLKALKSNYVYKFIEDVEPEITQEEAIPGVANEIEIPNEDIEIAIARIERNELKSELIELEEELIQEQGTPEEESNNNQIEEKDDNGFEWF